jgi:hypothetical protein
VDVVKVQRRQMEAHRRWREDNVVCRAMVVVVRAEHAALL